MAWDTILASLAGAIIGASIVGYISYRIYKRQNLMEHYFEMSSRIAEALVLSDVYNNPKNSDEIRSQFGLKINILLNQVYSYALTCLPDKIFNKLKKLFPTIGIISDADINQLYLELRKVLFRNTKIDAQDIITKKIRVAIPAITKQKGAEIVEEKK